MIDGTDGESLPDTIIKLILHIGKHLSPQERIALSAQVEAAKMAHESPTMIDVGVSPDTRKLELSNGPLPVRAIRNDSEGNPIGEVLVWVREGRLCGIEQAWFTDVSPDRWPVIEEVQILT